MLSDVLHARLPRPVFPRMFFDYCPIVSNGGAIAATAAG